MDLIELSELEKDALGEIMNISMGSAATAVSELLNAKVWITTPRVKVTKVNDMTRYDNLEPAVCVKIEYIKGLSGSNLMVLRQDDVQMILNQLMGQPLVVTPDFEFDELNISAVSEVMNQMMGASATALSDFLGITIDISTPTPYIMNQVNLSEVQDMDPEENIVEIYFDITIDGVIKSEFASIMSVKLAKYIATKMLGEATGSMEEFMEAPPVSSAQPAPAPAPAPTPAPAPAPAPMQQPELMPQMQQPMPQMPQMQQPMPQMQMPQMQQMPQMPPMGDPGQPYGYPPYGYQQPYPYPGQPPYYQPQPMNVQTAQLHQFDAPDIQLSGDQKTNLQLLMGVPLEISVEIGTAKRKVKDILEFTQGTIIELERQAGAPVDIIVNGNLIAKGDIVVIDDNFAVRITEIMKSKLMDSINKE